MKQFKTIICLFTLVFVFAFIAQAQEAVELEKTVVTATKTERMLQEVPASVSVVTSEEIERKGATSVADLLRDVPGVEILLNSSPASQRVMIRGEGSQRTLILIDGQKISENKSMDGAPMLIDPNMIERIEVIKGPASVLYGSEAIGGVVNIITKKAGDKPIQVTLSETYDSSTKGWNGFGSVFGLSKGFGYRVSAIYSDQGDLRAPDGTLDNTSFGTKEFNAYLDYSWEKGKVGVSYDKYTSDINTHTPEDVIGPPITYFQLDLPEWDREKYSGFIELTDISEFLVKLRADVYYQETFKEFHQDMKMQMPNVPFPPWVMNMDMSMITENDQDTTSTEVQLDWLPFENHYLITGFDYSGDDLDADFKQTKLITNTAPFIPDTKTLTKFNYKAKMDTYAFYIQDEWNFLEDFTLTAGFRETWIESELSDTDDPDINEEKTSDSHPVFSAGLVWTGIENLALRGLFAQGYKFPNLQQLYIGTAHGGSLTLPNPDLDPETSNNYEIGARYENDTFYFDVGAFMSRSKDYITTQKVPDGTAYKFINVNKAKAHGVELSAGYTIKQLYLTPYVTGAWLKRKFESDDFSTWKTGYPDLTGRFGVRYEKDFGKPDFTLFADLYGRAASEAKDESSDGTVEKLGSWETANFTIGTYFGNERQYRFDINANNIFDRKYEMAHGNLLEPGLHVVAKATITF